MSLSLSKNNITVQLSESSKNASDAAQANENPKSTIILALASSTSADLYVRSAISSSRTSFTTKAPKSVQRTKRRSS